MFYQNLDKDQREIFDYMQESNACHIYSKDQAAASELSITLILNALANGQSIALHLQDKELRHLIFGELDKYKLSSFTHVSSSNTASPTVTAKLNVLLKKSQNAFLNENSETVYRRSLDKIKRCCNAYNKVIFGSKTWKQITEIKDSREHQTNAFHINRIGLGFKFDQNEYWRLKGLIEEAAKLWNPLYNQIISQKLFHRDIVSKEAPIDILLTNRLKDLKTLKSSIYAVVESYSNNINEEFDQHFHLACEVIEMLEEHPNLLDTSVNDKKGISKLFTKKETITPKNERLIQIEKNPIFKEIDLSVPSDQLLPLLRTKLNQWQRTKQAVIQQNIKRLSKLNVDQSLYQLLNEKLDVVYSTINEDQVLNFKFENTAHSLLAQIDYIDQVIDIINRALWVCQYAEGFLFWEQFISGKSESEQAIINALIKQGDESWLEIFEHWYLEELVTFHRSPNVKLDTKRIKLLPQQYELARKEWIKNWINTSNTTIHETLQSLRKSNKGILATLLGKTEASASQFSALILDNNICPIIIGSDQNTSLIITDQNIKAHEGQKMLMIDFEGLRKVDFSLQADRNILLTLNKCPISKRLMIGRSFAHHLHTYSNNNRIFILKKKIIITCLSDLMNRKYLDQVKGDIVKEVSLGSEPVERITEYLLINELPCEIWIDNFVINDKEVHFILAQLQLIESLKVAGFTVLSKEELNQIEKRKKPINIKVNIPKKEERESPTTKEVIN